MAQKQNKPVVCPPFCRVRAEYAIAFETPRIVEQFLPFNQAVAGGWNVPSQKYKTKLSGKLKLMKIRIIFVLVPGGHLFTWGDITTCVDFNSEPLLRPEFCCSENK